MRIKTNKTLTTGLIAGAVLGVAFTASLSVSAFKDNKATSVPLEELQKFTQVYMRIKRDYVEEVDDKKLMSDAISGMLTGLDPHSAYLDEDAFTELQVGTSGEFGGLGIEVGMENGFVKVISPIDDTPAQKAGIESGDLIIRLDDKPVKGLTLSDAVKLMRGKPGEPINLMVVREGKDRPFTIKVVRDIIRVKSVKQRMLEDGFGYVRISSFQSKTTQGVAEGIAELVKENDGALKGLVLDLRNNPGGVLNGAVGVSDLFLESGKIVYTEGRVEDAVMRYDAEKGDILEGAPLVVLVNQGSASASEIVAGAVQDHKRALIVGVKTFGKGSVQTVLPVDQSTAVKLTTARYFTPLGRSIQATGIEPDIKAEPLKLTNGKKKTDDEETIAPLSEADLAGHLSNPSGEEDDKSKTAQDLAKEATKDDKITDEEKKKLAEAKSDNLVEEDFQLYTAISVLKSMVLAKQLK
ncbi:S41 family peptidase [Leucothrix arctica]|uniref:Peptidase S41 n=1 Tax=Leucothrix arctica TaxID=1481894 RepID=A0A317CJR5_9GAMM|nr:S41 family peptidase [Leucothrix arctica]PWQ98824.1 peptidase S41 [Leucothrix arctica]